MSEIIHLGFFLSILKFIVELYALIRNTPTNYFVSASTRLYGQGPQPCLCVLSSRCMDPTYCIYLLCVASLSVALWPISYNWLLQLRGNHLIPSGIFLFLAQNVRYYVDLRALCWRSLFTVEIGSNYNIVCF